MKKFYSICLSALVLSSGIAIAQPVVNGAGIPAAGTTITFYEVTATSVTQGSAGANQTWNFSSYPATGNSSTSQFINPSTSLFASMFPTATFATLSPTTGGNDGYAYGIATSSYMDLIGYGTHSTTGPDVVYSLSNAMRTGVYPTTYNSTYTDNFSAFATYVNGGYTINQYRYGTYTSTYDGYGTVTNLSGTFSNAVRQKIAQIYTDSIVVVGLTTSTSVSHSTTFDWTLPNTYTALFSLSYDTVIPALGSPTYSKTTMYGTTVTGIEPIYSSYKPLEVYPNPAGGSSEVHLEADGLKTGITRFVAVDMQGKTVKAFDFYMYPGNHKSVSVDVSDLAAGIYSIRLEQPDGIFVTRLDRQ